MTMLAVRSPPLEAWPAQEIATSAIAGGSAQQPGAPGPERPRDRPVAPAERPRPRAGRREAGHLDPPRRPGATVQQQVSQVPRAGAQAAQQRDRQQDQPGGPGHGEAPPRPPPAGRGPRQGGARPLAERLGALPPPPRAGRSRPRARPGRRPAPRGSRGRASRAARPAPAGAPDAERAVVGAGHRGDPAAGRGPAPTPKANAPPVGWPSCESTRHSTRISPVARRRGPGTMTARATRGSRRGGPGDDAPVGVARPGP